MYDAKVDEKLTSIKYLYRLPTIADSRKGCPYEVRSLNFVRIFKRRTKFVPTICKTNFSEDFVPLSRHRCVEVAAPYKYASINCYNFRGWMISAPTYFDRSEITPHLGFAEPAPLQGSWLGEAKMRGYFASIKVSRSGYHPPAKIVAIY